jgi:F-type H+-transporting ATPase subunit f
MQKVVSFYEKLPRGPAPEPEAKGLLGRYAKKYMGKNPSGRRA